MQFTADEAAAFWPIYRDCENQGKALGDERVQIIQDYARNFLQMTDAKADELIQKAMENQSKRAALSKACYERVRKVLSGVTAARFAQVENQLNLLIDLQIAASLPIVQ